MKYLVVFISCVAATSAGFNDDNGGGSGNIGYSAPASFVGLGGGYSSDYNSFGGGSSGSSSGFGGNRGQVQSNFGSGARGGFEGGNAASGFSGNNAGRSSGVRNGNGFGSSRGSVGSSSSSRAAQSQQGGQVRRFISVHVAPEEEAPREPRIIRAGGPPDTHYNIIFVKAPSGANQQKTEVVLPDPPKQKTLVYVLIKRPNENEENVKITKPTPTKPSKPEVYFIRYKPDGENGGSARGGENNGVGSSVSGVPNTNGFRSGGFSGNGNDLDSSYGPPSQQGSDGGYQ